LYFIRKSRTCWSILPGTTFIFSLSPKHHYLEAWNVSKNDYIWVPGRSFHRVLQDPIW
jgi:hypothetical protein